MDGASSSVYSCRVDMEVRCEVIVELRVVGMLVRCEVISVLRVVDMEGCREVNVELTVVVCRGLLGGVSTTVVLSSSRSKSVCPSSSGSSARLGMSGLELLSLRASRLKVDRNWIRNMSGLS